MNEPAPKSNPLTPLCEARGSAHLPEMQRLTQLWAEAAMRQGRKPGSVVCLALIDTIVRIMTHEYPPALAKTRREIAMELYAAADRVAPPPEELAP